MTTTPKPLDIEAAVEAARPGIILPPEDNPPKAGRQPNPHDHTEHMPVGWTGERETVIRAMHQQVMRQLADLRERRDMLNDSIRDLADEELRLARIVGILDGKRIHRPKVSDDQADAS